MTMNREEVCEPLRWRECEYEEMLAWAMTRKVASDASYARGFPCDNGTVFTDGSAISCGLESYGYCETCAGEKFACYIGEPNAAKEPA